MTSDTMPEDEAVEAQEPIEEAQEATVENVEAEDALMTDEEFSTKMDRLFLRARAAGLRPVQTMAAAYLRQGMALVDGLLSALGGDDQKKKPPPKE